MTASSPRGQHAGENLEPEVLFIAEPIGAALEDTDLVVQPLDEPERDLVLWAAVGGDPLPVLRNHRGELLIGPEALPLEPRPPVLEEAPRPALAVVAPQLPKGLFEQIGRVEPLVCGEQGLEGPPAIEGEVLAVRKEGVFLPLDEAAILSGEARVLALADQVEGHPEVAEDVELVEEDAGLRRMVAGRGAKGFPHVHHGHANLPAFPRPQPGEERVQTRLGAIYASEPDRPLPDEIGHHDAIGVPLSEGDLVEPDDPGSQRPSSSQLLAHVLLLQRLDGVPV